MLQLSGKEFVRACRQQDVGLDDILVEVLQVPAILESGMPTPLLSAIGATGDLLSGSLGEPLAYNRDISPTIRMRLDPVARQLARIINYSRSPDRNLPMPSFELPPFDAASEILEVCPAAEYHFLTTIEAMNQSGPGSAAATSCQVITAQNEPLMIRKSLGVPSALTLKPIAIGGIPYPPGSLVDARLKDPSKGYKSRVGRIEAISTDELSGVSPLRLSAFGLDRFRRQIDFFKLDPYLIDDEILLSNPKYMKISIADIGRIASKFVTSHQSETSTAGAPRLSYV